MIGLMQREATERDQKLDVVNTQFNSVSTHFNKFAIQLDDLASENKLGKAAEAELIKKHQAEISALQMQVNGLSEVIEGMAITQKSVKKSNDELIREQRAGKLKIATLSADLLEMERKNERSEEELASAVSQIRLVVDSMVSKSNALEKKLGHSIDNINKIKSNLANDTSVPQIYDFHDITTCQSNYQDVAIRIGNLDKLVQNYRIAIKQLLAKQNLDGEMCTERAQEMAREIMQLNHKVDTRSIVWKSTPSSPPKSETAPLTKSIPEQPSTNKSTGQISKECSRDGQWTQVLKKLTRKVVKPDQLEKGEKVHTRNRNTYLQAPKKLAPKPNAIQSKPSTKGLKTDRTFSKYNSKRKITEPVLIITTKGENVITGTALVTPMKLKRTLMWAHRPLEEWVISYTSPQRKSYLVAAFAKPGKLIANRSSMARFIRTGEKSTCLESWAPHQSQVMVFEKKDNNTANQPMQISYSKEPSSEVTNTQDHEIKDFLLTGSLVVDAPVSRTIVQL